MKNKHGSNVGITLGTVINYNILQHYSISITTLIVYFTQYLVLLMCFSFHFTFLLRYTLLYIFFFQLLHRLAHILFIAHFPLSTFCSFTFLIPFHSRSVITVTVKFSVYIKNLTLITLGCDGRLPIARFAHSPVPLSSCCSPSA
jgi:hypothetical protein